MHVPVCVYWQGALKTWQPPRAVLFYFQGRAGTNRAGRFGRWKQGLNSDGARTPLDLVSASFHYSAAGRLATYPETLRYRMRAGP